MSPIYKDHHSKRYEPPALDLENKNSSHILIVELTGENKNVLEVGTSTGYVSRILKEWGNTVTGIEIDPEAAEIARQHCDLMIVGDIEKLDLDAYLTPSSFDVIIFGDVLEHLVSPEDVLRKVKKYLRPDGYLAVSLPNVCHGDVILNLLMGDFKYTPMGLLDATHLRFFGLRNIIDLFSRCGYSITDIHTTVLPVGGTELRVDPALVPEDLANFVKSLPNASVYQYVFKASPSPGPEAAEAVPVPDLDDLFRGAIEGSIQAETKPILEELHAYEVRTASLDEQIRQQATQLMQLSNELASMKQSVVWQMLMKYHNGFVERALPHNTHRRELYDLGLVGLRVLMHEGPGSLWMRGKKRLQNKFRLTSVSSREPILRIPLETSDESVPLMLDTPLAGCFVSPVNQLYAIEVLTGLYERHNADLRLSIREGSLEGLVIRDVVLKGSRIVNNGYSRWEFKPIPDSKGKIYYFQIESTGSPSAALWYNSSLSHEKLQLFRDGKELDGQIGFQCFTKEAIRDPYELWILQNEPSEVQLAQMREECVKLSYRPKISIVTPVWNTDERWLRRAIESVLEQVYDNWELCIADGGSTKRHVRRVLREYVERDPRIRIKFLDKNLGIAGNSNEALAMATGEFVGFLDHDDELAPVSLSEMVKILNNDRDFDIFYSDSDKIDKYGRRVEPFFKFGFSLPALLSTNYPFHFFLCRKSLVDSIGGFRCDFEGSQDYDFILRLIEQTDPEKIVHIEKVLYHWRAIQQSSSQSAEAKPYAYIAGKRAIEEYLIRNNVQGSVFELEPGSYRVKKQVNGVPCVFIIIMPTEKKNKNFVRNFNLLLSNTSYKFFRLYIPKKYQNCFDYPDTHVYNEESDSYVDDICLKDTFDYAIFINDELLFRDICQQYSEWIEALIEHFEYFRVGLVGIGSLTFSSIICNVARTCGPVFCVRRDLLVEALEQRLERPDFDELQVTLSDLSDEKGLGNIFTPFSIGNIPNSNKVRDYYSNLPDRKYFTKIWNSICHQF